MKYNRMTDEDRAKIIKLYSEGFGCLNISRQVGFSKASVLEYLQKNVVMRHEPYRKYKLINEGYFDKIDTEDKAYFLGLLWADGCNFRKSGKTTAYQIHLNLQERDGDIIKLLAEKVYGNSNIVRLIDVNLTNHKYPQKRQKQYALRIPNKHISNTLLNYGMEPRKSFTLELPKNINFDEILWKAFIRGYYDGDGGISFNTDSKSYSIQLISSLVFCIEINKIINLYCNDQLNFEEMTRYSKPMARLRLGGNQKVEQFLNWLYKDSSIYLKRKYDKYMELVEFNKVRRLANS